MEIKDIEWKFKMLPEERKEGNWETSEFKLSSGVSWLIYKCSECGSFMIRATNFCPNCGARMKGE